MKFLIGFAVGAVFSRPVLDVVDRRYGHILRPKLIEVLDRIIEKTDNINKENNR
jgi:hypothetical protein